MDVKKVVTGKDEYRVEVVLHAERRKHVSTVNMTAEEREETINGIIADLSTEILTEIKKEYNLEEVKKVAKFGSEKKTTKSS